MTSFFSTLNNRYVLHHQHVSTQPLFRFDNKLFCIKNTVGAKSMSPVQFFEETSDEIISGVFKYLNMHIWS